MTKAKKTAEEQSRILSVIVSVSLFNEIQEKVKEEARAADGRYRVTTSDVARNLLWKGLGK